MSYLKSQFPIFQKHPNLVYLDSAATTQKPQAVIDSIIDFYTSQNSSDHSNHKLSSKLTQNIDETRQLVANFLNCQKSEIIFTSGATDSLNLIANGLINWQIKLNSTVLICISEHHSNILPFQRLAEKMQCRVEYFHILESGEINFIDFEEKVKGAWLVCVSHISNVLGLVNNIEKICQLAHQNRAIVVVDGTQAVSHVEVDLSKLNCDFYCFSGHKIYGPTGIGILYVKRQYLQNLDCYRLGGGMVDLVTKDEKYYKEVPYRFESGTSNFAGIIGLGAAVDWFIRNKTQIFAIEDELCEYTWLQLQKINGIKIFGHYDHYKKEIKKIPLFTCSIENINSFDLSMVLANDDIAIRSGQHCAGILHEFLGINDTWRISLVCYNTREDIDKFMTFLLKFIG